MKSSAASPAPTRLQDYAPPAWLVPHTKLTFELAQDRTLVRATLEVVRNGPHTDPLLLDGEELELLELHIDGVPQSLPEGSQNGLSIDIVGDNATITTLVAINPARNSRLMGLYVSGAHLCTQCESEGFRRITYFPDRPDVLSCFDVHLEADQSRYPVLLSNGNPGASGQLPGNRHFAEWHDPFPKPAYLFAVVAGNFGALQDSFTTASGHEVQLAIHAEQPDVARCHHAMSCLKQAMAFDEVHYGREYDLDVLNIVAVRDFNFGAMENKGLNIFNAKYVLADFDTATDADFDAIATVVAHEYFHNWSGNRVTLRDWFQLSLKEGFTVFRDQHFSASVNSPAVKRITTARNLRQVQFPEDAGPLAHPVRPQSYVEITNFYTATIYEKGAELIRMMATHLGPEAFRRASDQFFATNDGKAVRIEEFLHAMAGEGLDADAFLRWYEQAGTPHISLRMVHDRPSRTLELMFEQSNPGAPDAPPLPIPMRFALFDEFGQKLHERNDLLLTDQQTSLRLDGIDQLPIASLNRGFAAPITAGPPPSAQGLQILAAHEDDPFARAEALQQLMLLALHHAITTGREDGFASVAQTLAPLIADWQDDPALVAEMILPPTEISIGHMLERIHPAKVHASRQALCRYLARRFGPDLWQIVEACRTAPGDLSPHAKGLRRLNSVLLGVLITDDQSDADARILRLFHEAGGMTDRMAALSALNHSLSPARDEALDKFMQTYRHLPEVLDKWFLLQSSSSRPDTLATVRQLLAHPMYDRRNPNRLRAVLAGFGQNEARLHDLQGHGYRLLANEVLAVDAINPQPAARLIQPLMRWRRFAGPWGQRMQAELLRISGLSSLSRDLREVVTNGLD